MAGNLSKHKGAVIFCSSFILVLNCLTHFLFSTYNIVSYDFSVKVRGLEFNSHSPNLLASGAEEGDICIWDVSKPSEPSLFPPLKVCFRLTFMKLLQQNSVYTSFFKNWCT